MTFEKAFLLFFTLLLLVISPFALPLFFVMAVYAESGSQLMNTLGYVLLIGYPVLIIFFSYCSYKAFRRK
jgi:hypothetical protein